MAKRKSASYMTSGEQTKLSFEDTLSRITQGLSQRNQGKVILE